MKGIRITQEIKDLNQFAKNLEVGKIYRLPIPDIFKIGDFQYLAYKERTDLHDVHGWKDIISPEYNIDTQRLGELIEDGTNFTYQVIDLTQEEIETNLVSESESNKQSQLEGIKNKQAVTSAQTFTDEEAIEVADVYPFWSPDGVQYNLDPTQGIKFCKRFDPSDNIIKLFKTVQSHLSQSDRDPLETPALFTRVPFPNEILVWVAPTGAQDAYNEGDQVLYPDESGDVWESTVDANVFAPGVVAGQWILV